MGRDPLKFRLRLVLIYGYFGMCTGAFANCNDLLRQLSPEEIVAATRVRQLQVRVEQNGEKAGFTGAASNQAAEARAFSQLYQNLKNSHPDITPENLRVALKSLNSLGDTDKVTTEQELKELERFRRIESFRKTESFGGIFVEEAGVDKNVILDAKPESFEFVEILDDKAVTVVLGSPEGETSRRDNEPLRTVTLSGPMQMQRTLFTQEQETALNKKNPAHFKEDNVVKFLGQNVSLSHPVEMVSWLDAQKTIKRLNEIDKDWKYALPSDAIWEYAARAGTRSPYYFGRSRKMLEAHAWFHEKQGLKTQQVATKLQNPFGLFDMYGNVWEWTLDDYRETPRGGENPVFYTFESLSNERVIRGGSWGSKSDRLRSAYRYYYPGKASTNFIGFRLVRTPK